MRTRLPWVALGALAYPAGCLLGYLLTRRALL